MEPFKILVADDEPIIRKLINDFLTDSEFTVVEAGDGLEAMELFRTQKDISLVLLDVMMPGMDGWDVCREIRKTSGVPVVMLTARGEEEDELKGFELGVDEYISKPFSPKILVARIQSILNRKYTALAGRIEAGGVSIDRQARTAFVDGQKLNLCNKEFDLLSFLMENQGIVLSRDSILDQVWEYSYLGDSRTVDTHVKKLRSKMMDKKDYIRTIRGMGYKFEVTS